MTKIQARQGLSSNDGCGTHIGSYIGTCNGKKNEYMIDNATLLLIWQDAVSIIPDGEESVFLGVFEKPTDAPAGVHAVMCYWTGIVDTFLQRASMSSIQRLSLLTIRGFTFDEYKVLFDMSIKNYTRYPIYQSLLITTAQERASVIYQLTDSYDGYLTLLDRTLALYNPFLHTFLYGTDTPRTN